MFTSILFMFTSILFALAQASLPASPVEVRKEDSALLPISGAVLYNNVYGKGDIANYRQLVFRGKDDAGWEWDWPESGGPSLKNYPEVLLGRSPSAVLLVVRPVLVRVPFEAHDVIHKV
jgi:hypothetical protein